MPNNNNNNGNFICVFESTIVIGNLQILLEIKLSKKRKEKKIKIALSLGYRNSYFYNKRCKMLL